MCLFFLFCFSLQKWLQVLVLLSSSYWHGRHDQRLPPLGQWEGHHAPHGPRPSQPEQPLFSSAQVSHTNKHTCFINEDSVVIWHCKGRCRRHCDTVSFVDYWQISVVCVCLPERWSRRNQRNLRWSVSMISRTSSTPTNSRSMQRLETDQRYTHVIFSTTDSVWFCAFIKHVKSLKSCYPWGFGLKA